MQGYTEMQRSDQFTQVIPRVRTNFWNKGQEIHEIEIVLFSNQSFSEYQLSRHNISAAYDVAITQDKDNRIRIRMWSVSRPLMNELLRDTRVIDKLVGKYDIKDPELTKTVLIASLKFLHDNESFINNYAEFGLHEEIIKINNELKINDPDAILSLMLNDSLKKLTTRLGEAKVRISDIFEYILNQIKKYDESTVASAVAKTAFGAFRSIFEEENKKLNESANDLVLINNQINAFLKECDESQSAIENMLSGLVAKERMTEILNVVSNIKHDHKAINLSCWLFKKIVIYLKNNNLLSSENIDVLLISIKKQHYSSKDAINLIKQLSKLEPLINDELLKIVITGDAVNHSCDSRLKGSGLEGVSKSEAQERWGYCSQYAIGEAAKQFAAGQSLASVMQFLATFRQRIAINEGVENPENFGAVRNKIGGDTFADASGRYSATASEIFLDLVSVMQTSFCCVPSEKKIALCFFNNNRDQEINIVMGKTSMCRHFNWISNQEEWTQGKPDQELVISEKYHGVSLPKRTIKYSPNFDPTIKTTFSILSEKEQAILFAALQEHCIMPLKDTSLSQEDKLLLIGELAYYLSIAYPYKRGSAGIALLALNGLCQEQFNVTIGQINMGVNNNISFDVYAHLTTDVNLYKAELASKVANKIALSTCNKLSFN